MDAPEAFKRYDDRKSFRMISADGVMLKAREVKNYPKADLKFWEDALTRHMLQQGYVHGETECFKTRDGLAGCTVIFLMPSGAEDWVLSETIFVVDDLIVLVEVAGEFSRYQAIAEPLKTALKTFAPNR
jgi:hypothetical protein